MGAPQYEQAGADVSGSGTPGTIPVWSTGTTLTDSGLKDDGTQIYTTTRAFGVGTASPVANSVHVVRTYTNTSDVGIISGGNAPGIALRSNSGLRTTIVANYANANSSSFLVGTSGANPTSEVLRFIHTGPNLELWAENTIVGHNDGSVIPVGKTLRGPSGAGTNIAGGALTIAGGASTGNAAGGAIIFRTSPAGAAGVTANPYAERMRIDSAGNPADSQVAIGTSSFATFTGGAVAGLTTVRDASINGVRVGMGRGAVASNTAVGSGALNTNATGTDNTAIGRNALNASTASYNTAVGADALSGNSTGDNNTAVGIQALIGLTSGGQNTAIGGGALSSCTGSDNVAVGYQAGSSATSANANIIIGRSAQLAAATDDNKLVLGSAGSWVATNGGATTYYATAGASLGYIQVRLNGADVKIQVFAP